MTDLVVIGAGPAGLLAAVQAADLGARTTVVTSREFGGMAANDGPVPVRTLAHAGRLMRDARQLAQYGINVSEPVLDYPLLLVRVREVMADVRSLSLRRQIDSLRVTVHEQTGPARFVDPHTIETKSGLRLQADKIIICTGGVSGRLPVPGFDRQALTATPGAYLPSHRQCLLSVPVTPVFRSPRSSTRSARLSNFLRLAHGFCCPRRKR